VNGASGSAAAGLDLDAMVGAKTTDFGLPRLREELAAGGLDLDRQRSVRAS
jgi:hypothetical protein